MINTTAPFEQIQDPFDVHLAQEVLTVDQVKALYESAPLQKAEQIARTDPHHEKQYRMNLLYLVRDSKATEAARSLPPEWSALLGDLRSAEFLKWLEAGTGLQLRHLVLDVGIYTHVDGDFISVHKDKPTKAITAVLYLNTEWTAGCGGEYEVRSCADPAVEPVRRIPPRPGQVLAFPPTDRSWHSVSRVDTGGSLTRLTVQLEFWFEDEAMRNAASSTRPAKEPQ